MSGHDHDVVAESFAALRETKTGTPGKDDPTRRAVLVAVSQQRRRSGLLVRVALPLAAVIGVSSAWAAATGRFPGQAVVGPPIPACDAPSGALPVAPLAAAPPTTVGAPLAAAPPQPPPIMTAARPLPMTKLSRPASATASAAPAEDTEQALYRDAHRAFFADRDWPRALAAWDVYLASHPNGRLAPEARYNRALTLVRLGRRDEGRAALGPFAEGTRYDHYRQNDAKALLEALSQ